MLKIVNKTIFFLKVFLLLFDLIMTFYIMLMMNSYYENELLNLIFVCLPLFLVLIIFVISFFFKEGDDNTLFNVSSFLALITILIIDYRTICDQNMIMWEKVSLNFYYFKNQMNVIKALGYTIFIGNLLVTYHEHMNNKK